MANIGATTAFYKVETSLTRANNEVSKSMERLATGKQNANAGDRSSYAAMADTFRLDYVGTKAGIKGASVVMGYLETGMRVLDAAAALLARLQELAVLGANDTNSVSDHEAINLEAEAIAQEFNRLMNSATYKGKDIFVDTAGSEYVSMGGRNAEMTFGIGEIDYSEVFGATREIDAGLPNAGQLMNLTSMPSDAVVGPTFTGANAVTLTAGKIYEITTLPTNAADLAAYKAVLLASGNTTLQLESEIVVGSTFEVTSATDLQIFAAEYGKAATTGIDQSGSLDAGKTYIVSVPPAANLDYDAAGDVGPLHDATSSVFRGSDSAGSALANTVDMEVGDVLVVDTAVASSAFNAEAAIRLREVVTGDSAFVAGQEYEIVSMGTSNGKVDIDNFSLTQTASHSLDAGAIGRAVTAIGDGDTLAVGTTFTVDADASVAELAGLNALTQGMTFKQTTTTDAAFREIDASQITRNIEAVQKKINTARVQAGSQYAALESAVIYTTDLTAQYELGYNTVHDVNFSMETAHLAKNQILQQAATAMLAQANQGQQGLLQLIQG
jgi:flagellin